MSWFQHLFLPHESNNQRARLLHPSTLAIIIGSFTISQLLISHFSATYPFILGYASQISPTEVVRLTNNARQANGLPEVKLDSDLTQAALLKAADMFARDYWAHTSPNGTQPWYFITQSGYAYRYAGENLARDFSEPDSIVKAWMNSPTHRENLLSSRYQDIGVAVVDGRLEDRDTTLVVQMFGTKLSAAPAVGKSSFTVLAQEPTSAQIPPSTSLTAGVAISPFTLTKTFSIFLLTVIAAVLIIDVILVRRHNTLRWTSRSPAHLIFVSVLLVAALAILPGQIL